MQVWNVLHSARWNTGRKKSSKIAIWAPSHKFVGLYLRNEHIYNRKQEGQHPLTGQRAANFRLPANQWAERRLVTQWRHGYRTMKRSVCNACASNAGRSVCVQISMERSYPLPIYWYRSKGNWLRYNLAADIYITKLCSRLFVLYCQNCPKDDKFR